MSVFIGVFADLTPMKTPRAASEDAKRLHVLSAQALCHLAAGDSELANRVRLAGAIPILVDGPLARCAEEPDAAAWAAACLTHVASTPGITQHQGITTKNTTDV